MNCYLGGSLGAITVQQVFFLFLFQPKCHLGRENASTVHTDMAIEINDCQQKRKNRSFHFRFLCERLNYLADCYFSFSCHSSDFRTFSCLLVDLPVFVSVKCSSFFQTTEFPLSASIKGVSICVVAFALLLVAETMAWKIDQAPPCQSHKSNTSITHNAAGFGRKNGQQTPNSRILDEQNYFNTKSNICSEYKQQYTLILRLEFVTKQSNLYETMLHLVFVGYLPQSGNVVKIDGRSRP